MKLRREATRFMDFSSVNRALEQWFPEAKALGDHLTDYPEISGQEEKSCAYIVDFLRARGWEVETPYAEMPHSFRATYPDDACTTRVALLCEYDALPEIGHACGHSLSCAISVLAGLALREMLRGSGFAADLIGTPGEEFVGGKALMTPKGAFDGYAFAAMVHLNNENQSCFRVLASNDRFLTFTGKASHASAAPDQGKNALNAARLFFDAMDMWRQHLPADCQLHGIITYGGQAANIVPDRVEVDYYFRAATMEHLYLANQKAELAAKGAALATETEVTLEQRYPDYGEIFSDDTVTEIVQRAFAQVGRTAANPLLPAGSSDVGNVNFRIPVFHPMLDITGGRKDITLHSTAFAALLHTEEAYQALLDGAAMLCSIVLQLRESPETLEKLIRSLRAYRKLDAQGK